MSILRVLGEVTLITVAVRIVVLEKSDCFNGLAARSTLHQTKQVHGPHETEYDCDHFGASAPIIRTIIEPRLLV